jgi:hypothetical protein
MSNAVHLQARSHPNNSLIILECISVGGFCPPYKLVGDLVRITRLLCSGKLFIHGLRF